MFNIEYIHESNYRTTDIAYSIVAIIKKTHNYGNDQLPINAYYQALRELRKIRITESLSDTASVTRGSKGSSILDRTWFNIKNLWKGKKKEKVKELEKQFHTLPPLSPAEDLFRKIPLEAVFDELDPKEGLYEFRKKGMTSKNLASYLLKHLRELLKN